MERKILILGLVLLTIGSLTIGSYYLINHTKTFSSITLKDNTFIDAYNNIYHGTLNITQNNLHLKNLKVICTQPDSVGVWVQGKNVTLENIEVSNCSRYAIAFYKTSGSRLINSYIHSVTRSDNSTYGSALYVYNSSYGVDIYNVKLENSSRYTIEVVDILNGTETLTLGVWDNYCDVCRF